MTPTDWRPAGDPQTLAERATVLATIRDFFAQRGVMEVETPLLSAAGNSDPGLSQYYLEGARRWLRTSPEYALKRLLAAGCGDIYELGRVFRADESGRNHNPEFTMLEWYRRGWDLARLMDEVADLVRACLPGERFTQSRIAYRTLFHSCTGLDPWTADRDEMLAYARTRGVEVNGLDARGATDLLFSHFVQPEMRGSGMTFVYDFPPAQAALARIRQDPPPVAERFELFLGSVELANGYQELTDAAEQRQRFEAENRLREAQQDGPVTLDERLLAALDHGLPDCAGVALGVDRLIMARTGTEHLGSVIAFPWDRA